MDEAKALHSIALASLIVSSNDCCTSYANGSIQVSVKGSQNLVLRVMEHGAGIFREKLPYILNVLMCDE